MELHLFVTRADRPIATVFEEAIQKYRGGWELRSEDKKTLFYGVSDCFHSVVDLENCLPEVCNANVLGEKSSCGLGIASDLSRNFSYPASFVGVPGHFSDKQILQQALQACLDPLKDLKLEEGQQGNILSTLLTTGFACHTFSGSSDMTLHFFILPKIEEDTKDRTLQLAYFQYIRDNAVSPNFHRFDDTKKLNTQESENWKLYLRWGFKVFRFTDCARAALVQFLEAASQTSAALSLSHFDRSLGKSFPDYIPRGTENYVEIVTERKAVTWVSTFAYIHTEDINNWYAKSGGIVKPVFELHTRTTHRWNEALQLFSVETFYDIKSWKTSECSAET